MRILIVFLCLCTSPAFAQDDWREPDWTRHIAASWGLDPATATEVLTPDGSRADIVTAEYAYEVEWAGNGKWKESVAQAVFYAAALGKKPAVLLLIKDRKADKDDYLRCLAVCSALRYRGEPIRLETRLTSRR